jgi:hypothetical protein
MARAFLGIAAAAAAASVALAQLVPAMSCVYNNPALGVTYDLTGLMGEPHRVEYLNNNTAPAGQADYDYWFGVCENLGAPAFSPRGRHFGGGRRSAAGSFKER